MLCAAPQLAADSSHVRQGIILFPDDAKVLACKSSAEGRVFYLKFPNNRREFFWFQVRRMCVVAGCVTVCRRAMRARTWRL